MYGKGGKWLILEMVGVLRANRVHNQCRPFVIPRLLKDQIQNEERDPDFSQTKRSLWSWPALLRGNY